MGAMGEFAKLYGKDDDQILILAQTDKDDCPEVRVFFQPPGLGVSSLAIALEDTDNGWNAAEKLFQEMDEEKARKMIKTACKECGLENTGFPPTRE
jgi:hypothetical protein